MEPKNTIDGEKVTLVSCTNELWHAVYPRYEPDPMMDTAPYQYDFATCERAFCTKTADETRMYFAITCKEQPIGEIYLKHIDKEKRSAGLGIALINDSAKGKGYGTEAIGLLVGFAFSQLGLETIIADSVLRNTRSQHVLEKAGFTYTHEDQLFKYYRLESIKPE